MSEDERNNNECTHRDSVEITQLGSAERQYVCNSCGLNWSEPR